MEKIKMKTGIAPSSNPSANLKTFMLCFMAIIWRRVWITAFIYTNHNKIQLDKNVVLKSLKYNIYSEAGIGHTLKPIIKTVIKDGFIMPNQHKDNLYATRAIQLYKKAYEVIKSNNREEEIQFITDYSVSLYSKEEKEIEEVGYETSDSLALVNKKENEEESGSTESSEFIENSLENVTEDWCDCKLCQLVNAWDINDNLIYSDDPFQNVILKGLTNLV